MSHILIAIALTSTCMGDWPIPHLFRSPVERFVLMAFPLASAVEKICKLQGDQFTDFSGNTVRFHFGRHAHYVGREDFNNALRTNQTGKKLTRAVDKYLAVQNIGPLLSDAKSVADDVRSGASWVGIEGYGANEILRSPAQDLLSHKASLLANGLDDAKAEKVVLLNYGAARYSAYKFIKNSNDIKFVGIESKDKAERDREENIVEKIGRLEKQFEKDAKAKKLTSASLNKLYSITNRLFDYGPLSPEQRVEIDLKPILKSVRDSKIKAQISEYYDLTINILKIAYVRDKYMADSIISMVRTGNGSVVIGDAHRPGIEKHLKNYCSMGETGKGEGPSPAIAK